MYINYISDEEIEKFMKEAVKKIHLNDCCGQDSISDVYYMRRNDGALNVVTILSVKDGNRTLEENWVLNPFEAIKCGEGHREESKVLTKEWSRFIYSALQSKNKAMAEEYKENFMKRIMIKRDRQIENAKKNYKELVF